MKGGYKQVRIKFCLVTTVTICIIAIINCSKSDSSPIIAQIGSSKFTLNDLLLDIPPEYRDQITKEQKISYVKQWMNTELLYQEALRLKIDKEPTIKNRMTKMKKDLLSAEVINRSSLEISNDIINNTAITEYYNKNKADFIREKDKYKYLEIIVEDSKTAQKISKSLNNQTYEELNSKFSKNPNPDIDNIPYIPSDEIPTEIFKYIQEISLNKNSTPIKTDFGFHIIRIIDYLKKGDISSESEVREEIIDILTNKYQKNKIEKLLANLRLKTDIQLDLNLIQNTLIDTIN